MASDLALRSYEIDDVIGVLDRVNRALAKAESSQDMLGRVLDEMLDIFESDRAWLLYPASVDAEHYRVPMERTRPEWPGAGIEDLAVPMDDFARQVVGGALAGDGPISFGPNDGPSVLTTQVLARFSIKSMMLMAIHPQDDEPWLLGIHHCATARYYDGAHALFRAIGGRIADALTSHVAIGRLRASEERFRTMVEHAPEAIVILDCDLGVFTEVNPKACELFGVPRDRLVGRVGFAALSPAFQPDGQSSSVAGADLIARALGGEAVEFEWMHLVASGAQIPCEVRLVALPDPARTLVRGSLANIAVRKRAEQERAEVLQRLAQSQKLEAIGQLTGGIAHDFNNLLTVVLGNLEMAQARGVPESVQDGIQAASSAALRAASLVRRLLAFSRQQPLRPTALDVGELLGGMDDMMRRTLGAHVQVALAVPSGIWACAADATQLESAILNLVINARDAMPGGGIITVQATNVVLSEERFGPDVEVQPGHYVAISVSDDGDGMSEAVLDQIFAPFFTTKAVGRGSGLGLPMVYGFVRQSGGHVEAQSELGVGTTLRVFLPRATAQTPEFVPVVAADEAPRAQGEFILVVEDDAAVRKLTTRLLTSSGYRVATAADAAEALMILAQESGLRLILTDVVLPGGTNGLQLAEQVRARRPDFPVLLMSGYSLSAIGEVGRLPVGVSLLEKPFTRQELTGCLRQILDDGVA